MADRIKAAVDARTDSAFAIMARTDALASEGLEKTVERALAYVAAGADMIFPEAITDLPMYKRFKQAVKVPILANITEFGKTPLFSVDELRTTGTDMVLYPLSAFRAANEAALEFFQAEAGYTRLGSHAGRVNGLETGRWREADLAVASWYQHTSRDGDPQLHLHNQILHAALTGHDGKWRAPDSYRYGESVGAATPVLLAVLESAMRFD